MTYAPYVVAQTARLDQIAKLIYQSELGGTVEALLAANPELATLMDSVPKGTVITVPAKPSASASSYTRPWE